MRVLLVIWFLGFVNYQLSQSGMFLQVFGLRWGLFICDALRYSAMLCIALGVIYGVLYAHVSEARRRGGPLG